MLREEAARERARSEAREAQVAAATKALEEGRAAARRKEEELAAQALVRLGLHLTHKRRGWARGGGGQVLQCHHWNAVGFGPCLLHRSSNCQNRMTPSRGCGPPVTHCTWVCTMWHTRPPLLPLSCEAPHTSS